MIGLGSIEIGDLLLRSGLNLAKSLTSLAHYSCNTGGALTPPKGRLRVDWGGMRIWWTQSVRAHSLSSPPEQ